jgi:hypothetical protein
MLGNFFRVTCPYLYELDTVTYFGFLRDSHSHEAMDTIRSTTQLLLDVFRRDGVVHVHPLKVHGRESPTMYLPHVREGDAFRPLTESALVAEVLSDRRAAPRSGRASRPVTGSPSRHGTRRRRSAWRVARDEAEGPDRLCG